MSDTCTSAGARQIQALHCLENREGLDGLKRIEVIAIRTAREIQLGRNHSDAVNVSRRGGAGLQGMQCF